jgi:hypothetical protein
MIIIWEELQVCSVIVSLEFNIYDRDTTLEECGVRFWCGHHVGWIRVEHGGAACTSVLVHLTIRLRESISEFGSIERYSAQ